MEVIHVGKGKDTLTEVPKAPVYLTDEAKKHWYEVGGILAKNDLLKEKFLTHLELMADAKAQFEFAVRQIKIENKKKFGSGYVQTFKTGASNVSVYVTLKDKAVDEIMKCCKAFGLDPRSEKDLKIETGQLDLFAELMAKKQSS